MKGDIGGEEPVLVRMHALNVIDDVLGDHSHGRGGELQAAMRRVGEAGRGVIVLLREAQPTSLSLRLEQRGRAENAGLTKELRDYGVGAQILLDLGVKSMILLSNTPKTIVGLEGYGLQLVSQQPVALS